jgi:diguanylate cyclase (GGDEF)-like protein
MADEQGNLAEPDDVGQMVLFLTQLLHTGQVSHELAAKIKDRADVNDLISLLQEFQHFTLSLANGNLDGQLRVKGQIAGAMKSLQANLRHMTWQAQRIASGDLSQRLAFMGEFSTAFNIMVDNLAETRTQLDQRAEELNRQRRAALDLMLDAQAAREEAENANRQLQAQIVEINQLQEKLREQAIRDPLTGCFNRRYLIETLEREFARAAREDYPISLIMLDIDHFKKINDTFGHHTGDEVLRRIGQVLRSNTRPSDIAARYGGEEFVVVLPNMRLEKALPRAEAIRGTFPLSCMDCLGETFPLSLSAGVAAYPTNGSLFEEVLEHADKALYAAKNSGRNRVVCYDAARLGGHTGMLYHAK